MISSQCGPGTRFLHRALAARNAPLLLFDEDPELFARLDESMADEARARACAPAVDLDVGPWSGAIDSDEDPALGLGYLIVDGLLLRSVVLGEKVRSEVVGAGDVIRPWEHEGLDASVPFGARWDVLESTRLAILDARFLATACRWPPLLSAIVGRAIRRSHWLALQLAIADIRRVDERLLVLFWHLADRWGRVRRDGILVPLPVTHDVLAQLVAAQRPTVTAALQKLARSGLVSRRPDRTWLLAPEPPELPLARPGRRTKVVARGA